LGRIYGKEINERAKKSPSFSCKKYGKRRGQKILELPQHSVWVSSLTATPAIKKKSHPEPTSEKIRLFSGKHRSIPTC
jgi:hypothetical protein